MILTRIQNDIQKAKNHLMYSFKKVQVMNLEKQLSEDQLEVLESFSSRFARLSDLLVSRYFRTLALEKDPAFRGSVIDLLNLAEKFGWIENTEIWKRIRELRNVAAHEYYTEDILKIYQELISLVPHLIRPIK